MLLKHWKNIDITIIHWMITFVKPKINIHRKF